MTVNFIDHYPNRDELEMSSFEASICEPTATLEITNAALLVWCLSKPSGANQQQDSVCYLRTARRPQRRILCHKPKRNPSRNIGSPRALLRKALGA